MNPKPEGFFVRVLRHATGIVATVAVVVLASVAGMSAYQLYQPAALEADAIAAANAPVTSTTASVPNTVSPDSGITSFVLNPDGSITEASGSVQSVLEASAGDGISTGSSGGTDQHATTTGEPPSIGETQAVTPPLPETSVVIAESSTSTASFGPSIESVSASSTSISTGTSTPTSKETTPTAATSTSAEATVSGSQNASGQAPGTGTQPASAIFNANQQLDTLGNTNGANLAAAPQGGNAPQPWIERIGNTFVNGGIGAIDAVRSWLGLPPLASNASTASVPASAGI